MMIGYQLLRVIKFLSVMGFGGGALAALLARDQEAQKRAVHRVASPSLLGVWGAGYALLMWQERPLFELWIVGAVVLSLIAQGALVVAVSRPHGRRGAFSVAAVQLVAIVMLMVFKPTWQAVRP